MTTRNSYRAHLEELRFLGPNSVVYSDQAWAVARKASSGGAEGRWFPDHGSNSTRSLTAEEMVDWAGDWMVLREGES